MYFARRSMRVSLISKRVLASFSSRSTTRFQSRPESGLRFTPACSRGPPWLAVLWHDCGSVRRASRRPCRFLSTSGESEEMSSSRRQTVEVMLIWPWSGVSWRRSDRARIACRQIRVQNCPWDRSESQSASVSTGRWQAWWMSKMNLWQNGPELSPAPNFRNSRSNRRNPASEHFSAKLISPEGRHIRRASTYQCADTGVDFRTSVATVSAQTPVPAL